MIRRIGKFFYYIFLLLSVMAAIGMVLCVYSTHLSPARYPIVSSLGLFFPFFLVINIVIFVFWLMVKWRTAIVQLVAFICCWTSVRAYLPLNIPQNPPESSIHIMSFNTQSFGIYKKGDINKNGIQQYIKNSGADIVCLQEVIRNFEDKDYKLQEVYPYSCITIVPNRSRLAIFSKYPILDEEIIDYPTKSNSSVVYHLLIDGDTVSVINNHLESYKLKIDEKESYKDMIKEKDLKKRDSKILLGKINVADSLRALQTDIIDRIVKRELKKHESMIMCGDFNDTPVSYVLHRFTQSLDDAFAESGNGLSFTYHDNWMYFRIDHILISPNFKSYASKVDKSIKLSDHYPIHTYIKGTSINSPFK